MLRSRNATINSNADKRNYRNHTNVYNSTLTADERGRVCLCEFVFTGVDCHLVSDRVGALV